MSGQKVAVLLSLFSLVLYSCRLPGEQLRFMEEQQRQLQQRQCGSQLVGQCSSCLLERLGPFHDLPGRAKCDLGSASERAP